MKIQYLKYPFYHTILYDFFTQEEIKGINEERLLLQKDNTITQPIEQDNHHKILRETFNTNTIFLDQVYQEDRSKSFILNKVHKIYQINFDYESNPFLKYLKISNKDLSTLQLYKNTSKYFEHIDRSLLTCLFVFYDVPKKFEGGDFVFSQYNYVPYLTNNSCIIFPGFEAHHVNQLITASEDIVRFSINHRMYLRG